MRIVTLAAAALLVPALASGQAERSSWFGLNWSMASSTGTTKEFVSDYSFRGLGLEWRQMKGRNSYGLSLGWNVMNEETAETTSLPNVDLTGFQFRYINAYSILLAGHTYLGAPGRARPFLGVKTGTYYLNRRVDVGLWSISDNSWHFGVAPEIGFVVPLKQSYGSESFYTAFRYNYALAAGSTPKQSWFAIDVGIATRR
jgi:hypothetical protein